MCHGSMYPIRPKGLRESLKRKKKHCNTDLFLLVINELSVSNVNNTVNYMNITNEYSLP